MILSAVKLAPVVIAAVLTGIGLFLKDRPRGKFRHGIQTDAVVCDIAVRNVCYKHRQNQYKVMSPKVQFSYGDKSFIAVYPFFINENSFNFEVGDKIHICFDPKNPNRFFIENDGSKNNISFSFICCGLFIIISYIIIIINYR